MTIRDALNSALDEEMSRDKDVFIMGEEVRRNINGYFVCYQAISAKSVLTIFHLCLLFAGR